MTAPATTARDPSVPCRAFTDVIPLEVQTQIVGLLEQHQNAEVELDFKDGVLAAARLQWFWRRGSHARLIE